MEGDFFITNRIKSENAFSGVMDKKGNIVKINELDLKELKDLEKDFPYVKRFLNKLAKMILR